MLPKNRKRLEYLEKITGVDHDGPPWSLEKRLSRLEENFGKLCRHLDIHFHEVYTHTEMVVRGDKKP